MCGCLHAMSHWTSGHPRHVFEAEKKAVAVYLPRQLVPELSGFWRFIWPRNVFIPSFVWSHSCQVWQDGGIAWSRNWNSRGARIFVDAMTIIIVASSVVWMMGWLCVLETLHVTLAKSGSRRIGKCMTGPWSSSSNARQLLPPIGLMILWWTILSRFKMTTFKPHPSGRSLTGRPGRRMAQRERTSQPPHPSIPMIPARQFRQVCRWWLDPPDPTAHPGLGGLITIVNIVVIVTDTRIIIAMVKTPWVA